jgi:DNA-binding transcriptional regulator YiaG
MTPISDLTRDIRYSRDWSPDQLAAHLGVTVDDVHSWEDGGAIPRPQEVMLLHALRDADPNGAVG